MPEQTPLRTGCCQIVGRTWLMEAHCCTELLEFLHQP